MERDFPQLIGAIIHQCGAIEFLVNNAIMNLGKDRLLASEVTRLPLSRRIQILRRLLAERTGLSAPDVKALCDEIEEIGRKRNEVAHSPIARDDPNRPETEQILVVKHVPGKVEVKKISGEDLDKLLKMSGAAMVKFSAIVPEATKAD